jgi:hypothetical protein
VKRVLALLSACLALSVGAPAGAVPSAWTIYGFTPTTSVFTSGSGTFTIPAGATTCDVEDWGGGGGSSPSGGVVSPGPAGGASGYAHSLLSVSTSGGKTLNYSVGAGGNTAGTNGVGSSITSGTLSITTMAANPGTGGSGSPGVGGTATGGTVANTTGAGASTSTGGAATTGLNGNAFGGGGNGGAGAPGTLGTPGGTGAAAFSCQ